MCISCAIDLLVIELGEKLSTPRISRVKSRHSDYQKKKNAVLVVLPFASISSANAYLFSRWNSLYMML